MIFCLFGAIPDHGPEHHIILPLIMIPFAGGLSGFVSHLLDRSKSNLNLQPNFLKILKVFVFAILVGISFVLGLNRSY